MTRRNLNGPSFVKNNAFMPAHKNSRRYNNIVAIIEKAVEASLFGIATANA